MQVLETHKPGYRIFYITGGVHSGKTHLGVWLQELLVAKIGAVTWIEGQDLEEKIAEVSPDVPIIVDDAHRYLSNLAVGDSGPWVRLCESFRSAERQMYLLSSDSLETLPCDAHVISRINAGTHLEILSPADSDIPELITLMSKQRGFELSPKKLSYLTKRVGRSIKDIDALLEDLARGLFVDDNGLGFSDLEKILKKEV